MVQSELFGIRLLESKDEPIAQLESAYCCYDEIPGLSHVSNEKQECLGSSCLIQLYQ